MPVAAAFDHHKIFVLARGAHGAGAQFYGGALAIFIGVFEANNPVFFAGRKADDAEVATGFYHCILDAVTL